MDSVSSESEFWSNTFIVLLFCLSLIVRLSNFDWICSNNCFCGSNVILVDVGNSKGWKRGLEGTPPSRGKKEGDAV